MNQGSSDFSHTGETDEVQFAAMDNAIGILFPLSVVFQQLTIRINYSYSLERNCMNQGSSDFSHTGENDDEMQFAAMDNAIGIFISICVCVCDYY
jgi:hypothetical protein